MIQVSGYAAQQAKTPVSPYSFARREPRDKNGGDIRDVISIRKLVRKSDGPEQIGLIIKTMMKYGVDGE
jgi:hypothetical protein